MIFSTIYGTKLYAKVHSGTLSESQAVPGGCQLISQGANFYL